MLRSLANATACATATAFNRWIEEDWGFDHEGRIFAAAFISLQSLPMAVAEPLLATL